MSVVNSILATSQGIFNALIFVSHKVYNYRRVHQDTSIRKVLALLFLGSGADDDLFISRRDDDNYDDDERYEEQQTIDNHDEKEDKLHTNEDRSQNSVLRIEHHSEILDGNSLVDQELNPFFTSLPDDNNNIRDGISIDLPSFESNVHKEDNEETAEHQCDSPCISPFPLSSRFEDLSVDFTSKEGSTTLEEKNNIITTGEGGLKHLEEGVTTSSLTSSRLRKIILLSDNEASTTDASLLAHDGEECEVDLVDNIS